MGYGYEAIREIFVKFFDEMRYRTLYLDVNLFNERAIKAYEKAGFKMTSYTREVFENQAIDLDERYFEMSKGLIYSKIMNMKISKEDYYEL